MINCDRVDLCERLTRLCVKTCANPTQFCHYLKLLVKNVSYAIILLYPGSSKTTKVVKKSMVVDPLATSIPDIARWLEQKRDTGQSVILFLGARAGGLFRSKPLYTKVQHFSPH